jgi:mannose-6-phosphate isomerase-like protein (cupin superfamily)
MEQTASLIIPAGQARVYHLRFGEARILVDGERSGGAWWMGQFREDPGFMTLLHVHPHMDEQIFVLDGVLSLYMCAGWHDLCPGTLAVVPRGTRHAQGNRGRQAVLLLGAGNPAGFERFFVAQDEILSRIPPEDPQLPSEIARILGRHDTQVLGPPP